MLYLENHYKPKQGKAQAMEKKLKEIHMGFIFSHFFPQTNPAALTALFCAPNCIPSLSPIPATFSTELRVPSLSPSLP